MRKLLIGVHAMHESMLAAGVMTEDEFNMLAHEVEQCTDDPEALQIIFSLT